MKLTYKMILPFLIFLNACTASGNRFVSDTSDTHPNLGKLTVYREHAEPTAYPATIEIDGQTVVGLKQKGFCTVYLTPGKRTIRADWPAFSGQPDQTLTLNVKAGEEYFVTLVGRYRSLYDKNFMDNRRMLPGEEKMHMETSGGTAIAISGTSATVIDTSAISGNTLSLIPDDVATQHLLDCCFEQKPDQHHY